MFSTPERRMENETITFYVPVKKPIRLGLKLQATSATTLLPDVSAVKVFETLRTQALNELTKTEQLFKNKPTLASLDSITPKWGVIYNETEAKVRGAKGSVLPAWSPYTQFEFPPTLNTPCLVDLALTAILITRSTISPKFGVVFLAHESPLEINGSPKFQKNMIDFDWSPVDPPKVKVVPESTKDLEEVDDISEVDAGTLTLKDPVAVEKEKNDAKEYVRDLFRIADEARSTAIQAMGEFFRRYSVSDDESQFSEWVEEDTDASSDGIESLPELSSAQKKYEQGY
jgi:hypothetical protein